MYTIQSKVIFLTLCIVNLFLASSASDYDDGLTWYNARNEKITGIYADSTNIDKAIQAFSNSLRQNPKDCNSAEYYLRCLFFKASYTNISKDRKIELTDTVYNVASDYVKSFPQSTGVKLFYALSMAKIAETDKMAAIKKGIIFKIKRTCDTIIKNDPNYDNGIGYMLYGKINDEVPKIPIICTWPSKELAEEYLKKAIELNPRNLKARFFLAIHYQNTGNKDRALSTKEEALKIGPRSDYLAEDLQALDELEKIM